MRTTDEFLSQWMGVFDGKQNPLSGNLESFPLFLLLQYPGEVMRFKLYLRLERGRKVKQNCPRLEFYQGRQRQKGLGVAGCDMQFGKRNK